MKIKVQAGQNVFFTSDTHYGQVNICRGVSQWEDKSETRDFQTIDEMNKKIVENINGVVGKDDILIHLGDWSFGGIENIWNLRKQINCQNIYLILGNHDDSIRLNRELPNVYRDIAHQYVDENLPEEYRSWRRENFRVYARDMFTEVFEYKEILLEMPGKKHEKKVKYDFILMHYPIASWNRVRRGSMHLHGHLHLEPGSRIGDGKTLDVGIDGHPEFRPYSLEEVLRLIQDRPIRTMFPDEVDHHVYLKD